MQKEKYTFRDTNLDTFTAKVADRERMLNLYKSKGWLYHFETAVLIGIDGVCTYVEQYWYGYKAKQTI